MKTVMIAQIEFSNSKEAADFHFAVIKASNNCSITTMNRDVYDDKYKSNIIIPKLKRDDNNNG